MDFRFDPVVTKDLILSHFTEEQIMEYYLKVPIHKKKLFRSPLRVDKMPTCSIFRNNKGILIFKDFATGQHLNCFGVVMEKFHCNYYKALDIIANDFGLVQNNNITKNEGKINLKPIKITDTEPSKIQIEIQNFSENELKWWNDYGITIELLKKYNIYSCKYVFLNNSIVAESSDKCPIYGYYGGKDKDKKELWRCYFPKRSSFRFITNWPSKKIQGYDRIPKNGKLLIITKSMKDCLSMCSCGMPAIAPNSENLFITDNVLENLKRRFKYIVVFYDNDLPGITNMNKIKRKHPELNFFFIPRFYKVKDFSDFYAKYGRKKTIKTIKYYIKQLKIFGKNNFKN